MSGGLCDLRRAIERRLAWVQQRIDREDAPNQMGYLRAERDALRHVLAGGSLDPEGKHRARVTVTLHEARKVLAQHVCDVQYAELFRAIDGALRMEAPKEEKRDEPGD